MYADWLEEQGDIRAQLIRLQLAGETGKPLRKLMAENEGYLFGPLARMKKQLVWHNGFIFGASFHGERFRGDVAMLLAHASARFLVEVSVSTSSAADDVAQLAKAPASLRRLSLHDRGPKLLSIDPIKHLLPLLENLALVGAPLFEQMPLPKLKALQLDVSAATHVDLTFPALVMANVGGTTRLGRIDLPAAEMVSIRIEHAERAIAEARWPALKRLHIFAPVDVAALAPLFARSDMPALTRLSIAGATNPEQLVRLLRDAPFAKQLVHLELANGALDDAAARLLTRAAFPALEELDASNNPLSDAGYAALDALDIPDLVDDRRYDEMGE